MSGENHQQGLKRVLITGLGAASPLGCSVTDFWNGLLEGRSATTTLPEMKTPQSRSFIGAPVRGYDPTQHFSEQELQRLSWTSQLALVATSEAIADSRLTQRCDPSNVAVVLGGSIGGFALTEPSLRSFLAGGAVDPLTVPLMMNVGPASNVSLRFGFEGPLMAIDGACASSGHAIGYAYNLIRSGTIEAAVTGGADMSLAPGMFAAWSALRTLSERNDNPTQACRPFSLDRDGIVLSDGAAILILESEESALRRETKVYAELTGYAATSDSYHLTKPSLKGIARVMQLALSSANLRPEQIDYINAHGTATRWNDSIETAAIKEVFGRRAYEIPVVSIKGAIGHSIGATSAFELISCALSIREQILPPTINLNIPDPECDLDYVKEGKRKHNITHAISNSFAFGGSNAVLVISRYAR